MKDSMRCPYCGGSNITQGVRVGQTAEVGDIGLSYKTKFLVIGTEQLHADICNDCGTVSRFFVRNTARQWYTK